MTLVSRGASVAEDLVRPAHLFASLSLAAVFAAFFFGCSNELPNCYPGDARACFCIDGRRGYQRCETGPEEYDYGLCDCSLGFQDAGTIDASNNGT